MATPSAADALRVAGQLEFDGTVLGLVRDARFLPNIRTRDNHAEEWGGATVETIYAGESPVLLAVLMSWDAGATVNSANVGTWPRRSRTCSTPFATSYASRRWDASSHRCVSRSARNRFPLT